MDEQANDNAPGDSRDGEATAANSTVGAHREVSEAISPAAAASAENATLPQPEALPSTGWRPADYYATPRAASRIPKWVPIACGVGAIAVIGLMAIIGAFLQSGGLAKIVAIAFGQMNSDAEGMFDAGVTPDARASFKTSLLAVRDGIADGTIELQAALPLLQEMQKATKDRRLSVDEVEDLTGTFEESLTGAAGEDPSEPRTVDL